MSETDTRHTTDHGSAIGELEALLSAAVDAIVTIDRESRILGFNPAAEKLFGYSANEVLNETVEILMPSPYRENHAGYVDNYLRTGQQKIIGIGREVVAKKKDGTIFPVMLSVGEAKTEAGARFVGIVRDLTEQRAAEQKQRSLEARLEHVARISLMGEMAAGIAHEINQPLSAIAIYAQAGKRLLGAEDLEIGMLKESCDKISAQAHRAGEVIENLRRFIGKQEITKDSINVNDAINDVMGLIDADTKTGHVSLGVEFSEEVPTIEANAVQLQQVVLNLTRNAVDALRGSLKDDKHISVRTGMSDEEHVEIVVEDNGPGVLESLREGIFHPFVTTKRDGLGVGLAISRTIVEGHSGRLSYRPRPGGGSVFSVILPVTQGEYA